MKKYVGTFNWHGEVFELETSAPTKGKARANMLYRIATKVKQNIGLVRCYFNVNKDNSRVEEK